MITLGAGTKLTCAAAVKALLEDRRRWEVRSAGEGSKGQRWYAWAVIGTASPEHCLLIRRHLTTGELAFHYCFTPKGQSVPRTWLIRAAGLRWPQKRISSSGRTISGWTSARPGCIPRSGGIWCWSWPPSQSAQSLPPSSSAVPGSQAPPPVTPDQAAPADPGLIPLSVHEVQKLLAAAVRHPQPPGHAARWPHWRRRHQARSAWYHQRTRLQRDYTLVS